MSECLILNDASLPFLSVGECEQELGVFFSILHRANLQGITFYRADNIDGNWNSLVYAEGFVFGRWINEISDKDQCRLVKNVLNKVKCPLILTEEVGPEIEITELLFLLASDRNIEVQGLGTASQLKTHAISFASHSNWMVNPIVIIQQWDDNAAVKEKEVDVQNVFSLSHLDEVLLQHRNERQSNKKYFGGLSTFKNKDFPNLIFCNSALNNINSNSITSTDFSCIVDAFNKLNNAICESNNRNELVEKSKLNITGESSETMNTPKHARKRFFKHPNLGIKSFEDHVKNFPGEKRMHILADYTNKTVCIGYFGRHLSNVSVPK